MEQPVTAAEPEHRYHGAVRIMIGITLAIGSWAVVLGGAWLAMRYITG